MDWRDYSYLKSGAKTQRKAYKVLNELNIFSVLRNFDPALVSTVCVNLHTSESDLDIICQMTNESQFKSTVKQNFGNKADFQIWKRSNGAIVAKFSTNIFPVEIFASDKAVEQQYAWRHLSMMHRVLSVEPKIREKVRELKKKGTGTEEAFAKILGLEGDPYEVFLTLEEKSDQQIKSMCQLAV